MYVCFFFVSILYMSGLISSFKRNYFYKLQTNLNDIFLTSDCLSLFTKIHESIKILTYLSHFVRCKENKFGSQLPHVILAKIFSFFSLDSLSKSKFYCTCKLWREALKSSVVQNIIIYSLNMKSVLPTHASFEYSCSLSITPTCLCLRKDRLLICDIDVPNIQEWNSQGKLIDKLYVGKKTCRITASFNYFCLQQKDRIIVLNNQNINICEFRISFIVLGFVIENQFLYISSKNKICIFSLIDGKKKYSWNIWSGCNDRCPRKLAVYQEKIFMMDTHSSSVTIFAKHGVILGKFGALGENHRELNQPWGIAITKNIVYIADTGNSRIQAFTHEGKFLFVAMHPERPPALTDLCVLDNLLFVSDWKVKKIFGFRLKYE